MFDLEDITTCDTTTLNGWGSCGEDATEGIDVAEVLTRAHRLTVAAKRSLRKCQPHTRVRMEHADLGCQGCGCISRMIPGVYRVFVLFRIFLEVYRRSLAESGGFEPPIELLVL